MRFRGPSGDVKFNALNRAMQNALERVDHIWGTDRKGPSTVTFAPSLSIISVTVPAPPTGYQVLVESWANFEWTDSSAHNVYANIERGKAVVAKSRLHGLGATGGESRSYAAKAIDNIIEETTYRLVLRWLSDRQTITINTHGITARYVIARG